MGNQIYGKEKVMSEQTTQENKNRKTEAETRTAVKNGENVQETVRNITLKAMSTGHLDLQKMREVVQAVLQGASIGAKEKGKKTEQSLQEAMAGVDEALAKSAEASKLAIEEAASHIREFGAHDFKRAMDDLNVLEDMLLDTVKNIAKTSDGVARDVFGDLAQHGRNTGTTTGKTVKKVVETLTRQLEQNMKESVNTGADKALKLGEHLAQATAGFLQGIAETLMKTGNNKKE